MRILSYSSNIHTCVYIRMRQLEWPNRKLGTWIGWREDGGSRSTLYAWPRRSQHWRKPLGIRYGDYGCNNTRSVHLASSPSRGLYPLILQVWRIQLHALSPLRTVSLTWALAVLRMRIPRNVKTSFSRMYLRNCTNSLVLVRKIHEFRRKHWK